jgi:hypothetical protein
MRLIVVGVVNVALSLSGFWLSSSSYNCDATQPFVDTTLIGAPHWPCPLGGCWTLLDTVIHEMRVSVGLNHPRFWGDGCPYCQPCGYAQCLGYASCFGIVGGNASNCYSCQSNAVSALKRIFRPIALTSCVDSLADMTMCKKGHYRYKDNDASTTTTTTTTTDGSISSEELCVPCLDARLWPSCLNGLYPSRCATSTETACVSCAYPPLRLGEMYGGGALYEDCDGFLSVNPDALDVSGCAFFQTPKWEAGYCAVHCASGYTPLSTGGCARCNTTCLPGTYPTVCPGGVDAALDAYACLPCEPNVLVLPSEAQWQAQQEEEYCNWACAQGFYAFNDQCMACDLVIEDCTAANYYWLGCGLSSPGGCRSCEAVECIANLAFRVARPYESACRCQPCNAPVDGVTYVVSACTPLLDAVLGACSTTWECAAGTYQTQACTLWSDRLCASCTAPIQGKRLLVPCNASNDARYGNCPAGMACDGGPTPFACVWPRVASYDGRCVCLAARVEPDCAPMPCADGLYPDNRTLSCAACAPSYIWDTAMRAQSRTGVMGQEACGCPVGYLRAWRGERFDCWPCGDLGCVPGVERQTPCGGFDSADPTCACATGPGMRLLLPAVAPCAMACSEGFRIDNNDNKNDAAADNVPSLYYGDHGFVAAATEHYAVRLTRSCPLATTTTTTTRRRRTTTQAVLLNQGQFVLQLCDNNNELLLMEVPPLINTTVIVHTKTLSAEETFRIEGVRANIQLIDLVPQSGNNGLWAWLLIRFWGMCDEDLVNSGTTGASVRWCVAVEFITANRCQREEEEGGLCLLRGTNLWGKTFPLGVVGEGGALAVSDDALFLWRPSLGLHRYAITFYEGSTPYDERAQDPLVALEGPSLLLLRSMAYHMGTLYVLFSPSGVVRALRLFSSSSSTYGYDYDDDDDALLFRKEGGWDSPIRAWSRLVLHHSSSSDGLYMWDAPNAVISSAYNNNEQSAAASTLLLWFAMTRLATQQQQRGVGGGVSTLMGLNGTHLLLEVGARECDWDTFASSASDGACVPMPCTRAAMCDPLNGMRARGNTSCGCLPGFFLLAQACAPCEAPFFCVGGQAAPAACANAHSETIVPRARSSADCVCVPGTFVLGARCLDCPTNMWCPFHGTVAPLECVGDGWTISYGAQTPLDCRCPISRTYGLACTPCSASMDCTTYNQTTVSALRVVASGGLDGEARLVACIGPEGVHYSLLGVSLLLSASVLSLPEGKTGDDDDLLIWDWAVVLPVNAIARAKACMASSFSALNVNSSSTMGEKSVVLSLGVSSSCGGRHVEWTDAGCACVAGYEAVDMGGLGGVRCLPCLNGTFRAPYTMGRCVACPRDLFVHAPFLGMTTCVCMPGYDADRTTGACLAIPADDPRYAPPWSATSLMSLVLVGAGVGAAALSFACVMGCVLT